MAMENVGEYNLYNDIQSRTGGEIYIGVVGPVRSGKSTFIKRFMELYVLPNMDNENVKKRAQDELPQSAAGRTIMTTEPKFIPKEAAHIHVGSVDMDVRLIDCVGYMVDGAFGHEEDNSERMVKTPWFDYEIPFTQAAEIGTRKVINDHSTIGVVITTDGSFGEIERDNYIPAEDKTIQELKKIGKPFVVLLNTTSPYGEAALKTAKQISDKNNVTVIPVNCAQMHKEDVDHILESILYEFPVSEIRYYLPKWISMLAPDSEIKKTLMSTAADILKSVNTMKDVKNLKDINKSEYISDIRQSRINGRDGTVSYEISIDEKYYYQTLTQIAGMPIENEYQLIDMIKELTSKKNEYTKVASAISDVAINGYSVVIPERSKINLFEPETFKNGQKYGVKIKAEASAIYMIETVIQTDISPVVGSKAQADDLIEYINQNKMERTEGIWDTNIFGKTVEQIVEDGIDEKIHNITDDNIDKIRETLQKVMNENSGLVCLIV